MGGGGMEKEDVKLSRKITLTRDKLYRNTDPVNNFNKKLHTIKCLHFTAFQDSSSQTQTHPITEAFGSSDLLSPLLLKELQCIMDAFSKLFDAVKQMHQIQNSLDKFGILIMCCNDCTDFKISSFSISKSLQIYPSGDWGPCGVGVLQKANRQSI
ncbi:hypothetical protein CEXT_747021 [Caerostris extrusa]|uniref:Uncharacterized protein n=1 Tax=Caerostris extrusa TaxID=172846 RepID=A0AAV4P3H8_CAEEX|nr:hypothetical protein CEXT_747021 [Caerostris extrusa]